MLRTFCNSPLPCLGTITPTISLALVLRLHENHAHFDRFVRENAAEANDWRLFVGLSQCLYRQSEPGEPRESYTSCQYVSVS